LSVKSVKASFIQSVRIISVSTYRAVEHSNKMTILVCSISGYRKGKRNDKYEKILKQRRYDGQITGEDQGRCNGLAG